MEGFERFARYFLDLEVMARAFGDLLRIGLPNTIILAFGAMGIGLSVGMVVALMAISRHWWIRLPARVYVDIFRGLPAILTIMIVGIGLPLAQIRPFGRNTFAYAILALGLISTAYVAEIYRAGLQAIPGGQMEASLALGMSRGLALRRVIIPQATRIVIPPVTNDFIALFKDTSVCSVITLIELSKQYQILANSTGGVVEFALACAAARAAKIWSNSWWAHRVSIPLAPAGSLQRFGFSAAAVVSGAAAFFITGLPPTQVTPSPPIILAAAAVAVCAPVFVTCSRVLSRPPIRPSSEAMASVVAIIRG
jgi:His/Glu/Gln/Arg/opine family amino acid ABC transporter permease subunit